MDQNACVIPDASDFHLSSVAWDDQGVARAAWGDPIGLMPNQVDLGDPASVASLRRIDAVWPALSDTARQSCLRALRFTIPTPRLPDADVALLPGGTVVVLDPKGVFCCDPLEAVSLNEVEAKRLHGVLMNNSDTMTLSHTRDGVVLASRVPHIMSRQSVTVVKDAGRLPGRAAFRGRLLVQWCSNGATIWPMVLAPNCIALATGLAAVTLTSGTTPAAPLLWNAPNINTRFRMLAPALSDHVSDLLATEVCDDLRLAIMELCVNRDGSLASQLAEALALLPSPFHGDPSVPPGELPDVWEAGASFLRQTGFACALIGIERCSDLQRAVHAIRDQIDDPDSRMFGVSAAGVSSTLVSLANDAALSELLPDGSDGRIGVLVPHPHSALELYTIISNIARQVGAPVIVSAPCWGFCHRVSPNGVEAGNGAWFGMGIGLDEIDALVSDIVHWA